MKRIATSPITGEHAREGAAWRWAARVLALLVLVPLAVLFSSWVYLEPALWRHLWQTVLPALLANTAVLVLGVSTGTLLLGVPLAWLVARCEFPGRRWLDWALMLPFALPPYVLAFVFLGLLDFAGPVQGTLRALFDLPQAWALELRNGFGVAVVMTLVFYPYVYMLARVSFLGQGASAYEAARVLGLGPWRAFWRVSLPMARPGIVAGLSLALMETLADFGAVAVFNYDTFTTAIYKAWFGFFDLHGAAQLASILLLLVFVALLAEQRVRSRARHAESGRSASPRIHLRGARGVAAALFAGTVFALAFAVPVAQLAAWAWETRGQLDSRYLDLLWHTLMLGGLAALCTVAGAFVLAYVRRHHGDGFTRIGVRIATLGYALPGSVLAVGVMLSLSWLDDRLAGLWAMLSSGNLQWTLAGGLPGLLLAYFVRFQAVAFGPVDAALVRVRPSLREAARSLGATPREVVRRIYVPLLRPGLLTAALLVLVDVMKEMPATLLLRPFGWDTLAVRIYELTSEGEWERAAAPAVALVAAGLIPVILLVRRSGR